MVIWPLSSGLRQARLPTGIFDNARDPNVGSRYFDAGEAAYLKLLGTRRPNDGLVVAAQPILSCGVS